MYRPPRKENPAKSLKTILNLVMGIIYISIGLYLLFAGQAARILQVGYLMPVGVSLVLYGLFRSYRAYLMHQNPYSF